MRGSIRSSILTERGVGKTSLACQIANWAMREDAMARPCKTHRLLPVLIEPEVESQAAKGDAFLNIIHPQLELLIGRTAPISEELLHRLLRRQRVLVIIDGFSEMSDGSLLDIR